MIQCLLSTIVKHQCTTVKAESVNNTKLSTQVFSFLGIKVERQQTFTKLISTYFYYLFILTTKNRKYVLFQLLQCFGRGPEINLNLHTCI